MTPGGGMFAGREGGSTARMPPAAGAPPTTGVGSRLVKQARRRRGPATAAVLSAPGWPGVTPCRAGQGEGAAAAFLVIVSFAAAPGG